MAPPQRPWPAARPALAEAATVLLALWAAKAVAPVPYLGTVALTAAAYLQIYLPMRYCERRGLPYAAVGLSLAGWRRDLATAAGVAAGVLPLYALALHVALVHGHGWLAAGPWPQLAPALPALRLAPEWPQGGAAMARALRHGADLAATHYLGVALPEEAFYRGALQVRLAAALGPGRPVLGGRLGRAACLSCALFALGHFLGEWHPVRLLPFFPGLLFAWLRSRGHGIVGCVWLHGTCNLVSAACLAMYRPV